MPIFSLWHKFLRSNFFSKIQYKSHKIQHNVPTNTSYDLTFITMAWTQMVYWVLGVQLHKNVNLDKPMGLFECAQWCLNLIWTWFKVLMEDTHGMSWLVKTHLAPSLPPLKVKTFINSMWLDLQSLHMTHIQVLKHDFHSLLRFMTFVMF